MRTLGSHATQQSHAIQQLSVMVCAPACQIAAWCESYRALRAMGFGPAAVGGALTLHPDSLADATEACLAAQ